MGSVLVADIGGTNTRLAVAAAGERPAHIAALDNDAFAGLEAVIRHYLAGIAIRPDRAVLAVASPIEGDEIALTNRAWRFRPDQLRAQFGFSSVDAINDFEAIAWALPGLRADEKRAVGPAVEARRGAKVALGPGTGLGVAALVPMGSDWVAVASEGGHISFGATSPDEVTVINRLAEREPVAVETVISGPGLERLFRAVNPERQPLDAKTIVALAQAGDGGAVAAVKLFVRLLGRFAGDMALTFKAVGGVYIAGGIVMRLGPLFDTAIFRKAFEAHPPYEQLLAHIPTFLVTCAEPGLVGCAAFAERAQTP